MQINNGDDRLLPSGNLWIGANGTFDLNGNDQTVGALSGDAGAEITDSTPYSSQYHSTLTVNYSGPSPIAYAGSIDDGPAGHVVALVMDGAGTLILSGDNSYSGGTTVQEGTLIAGSEGAFGPGPAEVDSLGVLDLAGYDAYFASLSGGGTVQSSGGPATLGVGGGDDDTTFSGTLQDGTAANSQLALNVVESGTLTLSGVNTYTGGTFLDSGTLSIASDASIGGATSYIEFDGGTLQVTGASLTNLDSHAVNWGSFDGGLDIADATNNFIISEAISGSGGLTKLGSGTLVLAGADTYTGQTIVAVGTLDVEGSLTSPVVKLTGASLSGPGAPALTPQLLTSTPSVTAYVGQTATLSGSLLQWPNIAAVGLLASNSSGAYGTVVNNDDGTWTWTSPSLTSASDDQTVTITATDGTSTAATSFDLTVNSAVPYNVYTTTTVDEYGTTVSGLFSDPLPNDPCTVTIDWGDGTSSPDTVTLHLNSGSGPGQTSFSTSTPHTYAVPGDYTIATTVSSNSDGQASTTATTDATVYGPLDVSIEADVPVTWQGATPGEFTIGLRRRRFPPGDRRPPRRVDGGVRHGV